MKSVLIITRNAQHGRGDEFHHGSQAPDPREQQKGPRPRDVIDLYLHFGGIKVKTRDFRWMKNVGSAK